MSDNELNKLDLKCGVTLELQAVKQYIALDLLSGIGGLGNLSNVAAKSFSPEMLPGFMKLLNYLIGWGVRNDVPEGAKSDFASFGGGERITRSMWVKDIATEDEISQLFAQILALTLPQTKEVEQDDETERLRNRIAELEAQQTGE